MAFYQWTAVYSIADTAFAGTYTVITSATIPSEAVAMRITTTLDQSCMLSLDGGTTDHLPVTKTGAGGNAQIIPLTDQGGRGPGYTGFAGNAVYVKDIGTSSTGSLYISFLYRV